MNELENKKQFKCIWVGPSLKEEKEIILYPNKNGTVATLLEEAKKQVELSENGSGKLRLLEINCNKLLPGPAEDVPLDNLSMSCTKLYRIEEIPTDELNLAEGEMLVPVAHFHKDVFSTFGIPFFFKIKNVSISNLIPPTHTRTRAHVYFEFSRALSVRSVFIAL